LEALTRENFFPADTRRSSDRFGGGTFNKL